VCVSLAIRPRAPREHYDPLAVGSRGEVLFRGTCVGDQARGFPALEESPCIVLLTATQLTERGNRRSHVDKRCDWFDWRRLLSREGGLTSNAPGDSPCDAQLRQFWPG
jgi:hypothetical protein